ncbi:hypothetical protein TNCV_4272441 [Trichonephila clavipes]|nr:hypothetical protein TNCV_4272441 [Trichonephila clavipes]
MDWKEAGEKSDNFAKKKRTLLHYVGGQYEIHWNVPNRRQYKVSDCYTGTCDRSHYKRRRHFSARLNGSLTLLRQPPEGDEEWRPECDECCRFLLRTPSPPPCACVIGRTRD